MPPKPAYSCQFRGRNDRKKRPSRPQTKPWRTFVVGMFSNIYQAVKRLTVNQRLKIGAYQNVGGGLTRFRITDHPDWMIGPGCHPIAHIRLKLQPSGPLIKINGDEGGVVHRNADLLNRCHKHIVIAVPTQNR